MVRRTKEEAQQTRDALLDAAERVFERRGVAGTSLQEVAEAAGVTRGAVYWHFRDKADLFNAMMDRAILPFEPQWHEAAATDVADPLRRLQDVMLDVLGRVASDERLRRVAAISTHKVEYVGEHDPIRERHLRVRGQAHQSFTQLLRQAAAAGQLARGVSPEHAAYALHALIDGLVANWTLDCQAFDLRCIGGSAVRLMLAGLTGVPAAEPAEAPAGAAATPVPRGPHAAARMRRAARHRGHDVFTTAAHPACARAFPPRDMTMSLSPALKKKLLPAVLVVAVAAAAWWSWSNLRSDGLDDAFVSGNGRLEATEVDVATRLAGRVVEVLVREGDFVKAGQPLARMQLDTLEAQRAEARAGREQALQAAAAAQAQVLARQSDVAAAQAQVVQRQAELDAAKRRLTRSKTLSTAGAMSTQEFDDDQASVDGAAAVLTAMRAQVAAAQAAVAAAKAQVDGAQSNVAAAAATIERIEADIRDSELKAPRDGRVQFIISQPGEVLAAGGRVLNMLDVSDVYMTFFVPNAIAGRVALGSEARLVIDAAPGRVIPAAVSFVASQAQFTPKTVETASEREKLMFRVRAQIAPELLRKHLEQVKTGVPGVAWLRLDPAAQWPASLALNVGP